MNCFFNWIISDNEILSDLCKKCRKKANNVIQKANNPHKFSNSFSVKRLCICQIVSNEYARERDKALFCTVKRYLLLKSLKKSNFENISCYFNHFSFVFIAIYTVFQLVHLNIVEIICLCYVFNCFAFFQIISRWIVIAVHLH